MPEFLLELQQLTSGNPHYDKQMGKFYHALVAWPPGDAGSPSMSAFYFPDDEGTFFGESLMDLFEVRQNVDQPVCLELRSLAPKSTHQIKIYIPKHEIRPHKVSELLLLGARHVHEELVVTKWNPPWSYSSAPSFLELVDRQYHEDTNSVKSMRKRNCYIP